MDTRIAALRALAALDLTSLNETDDASRIRVLCAHAGFRHHAVAAVCVYPEWIVFAKQCLREAGLESVRVATVCNFPDGSTDLERAVREAQRAISAGADEVDVVFPWRALQAGDGAAGTKLVASCKSAIPASSRLKVILETGELMDAALIRRAADLAIAAGADFIKTSTGKVKINATLEAASIMLDAIEAADGQCGLKIAGGVRTMTEASAYLQLVDDRMGADWATPARFRFGASGLLDEVIRCLSGQLSNASVAAY